MRALVLAIGPSEQASPARPPFLTHPSCRRLCPHDYTTGVGQIFFAPRLITGEIAYSYDLFRPLQEHGWLNIRRGVASIRDSRTQRRVMSA
jgi:hypothetical protein